MAYITQNQLERLKTLVQPGKVIILYGPRRVGKTTLIKKFLESEKEVLFVTGEDLLWSNNYFWRTYDQHEIDWVEEREGSLFGYEFKWNHTNQSLPSSG